MITPLLQEDEAFLPNLFAAERSALAAYHREHESIRNTLAKVAGTASSTDAVETKTRGAARRQRALEKKAAAELAAKANAEAVAE